MAARIFYQEDCNLSVLEGQKIAIIGYGSQGHAHALNLKDSGCDHRTLRRKQVLEESRRSGIQGIYSSRSSKTG